MNDYIDLKKLFKRRVCTAGRDMIKDIVRRFGDQEFSAYHIMAVIKKEKIPYKPKHPAGAIHYQLTKLVEEGYITCTFTGKSKSPSIFKRVGATPEAVAE